MLLPCLTLTCALLGQVLTPSQAVSVSYYDGVEWKSVPPGANGQLLRYGECGKIDWVMPEVPSDWVRNCMWGAIVGVYGYMVWLAGIAFAQWWRRKGDPK